MISTERHSQHQAMEELQDFKLADLFAKLRLDDDEFHEWLADIGLLHGSRTCTCGNLMKRHRAGSGSIHWRCNRAMHRPSQPSIGFKVGTFFENAQLDCKTIFKLAYLWCMNLPLEYAEFETGNSIYWRNSTGASALAREIWWSITFGVKSQLSSHVNLKSLSMNFLSQRPSLGPQLKQDHMLKQKSQKNMNLD